MGIRHIARIVNAVANNSMGAQIKSRLVAAAMTVPLSLHRDSALAATAATIITLECTLTLALVTSLEVQGLDLGFVQQERQMVTLVTRMTIAGADNLPIGIPGLVNCFARAIGMSIEYLNPTSSMDVRFILGDH